MPFPLLALPTELIIITGSFLPAISLNRLARTNRFFYALFNKPLWNVLHQTPGWEHDIILDGIRNGNVELVKKLVEDFNLDLVDYSNYTFIGEAVDYSQFEVFDFLMKRLHGKPAKKRAIAAVIAKIAAKGNHDQIRKLMRYKLNVTCLKDAFEEGLACGYDKVVRTVLTEYRPNMTRTLRKRLGESWPYLHCAVAGKNPKLVSVLLEHGADVNIVDRRGQTALFKAAEHGDLETARVLLENGIDLTVEDKGGFTALTLACSAKTVRLLFEYGASLDLVDWDKTPIWNPFDFVELLEEDYGITVKSIPVDPNTLLQCAAHKGLDKYVLYFLEQGADVNSITKLGERPTFKPLDFYRGRRIPGPPRQEFKYWTPLHFAIHEAHMSTAQLLIQKGAQVNPGGRRIKTVPTPLHLAATLGNKDMVGLLLSHGANVRTAYHPPAKLESHPYVRFCKPPVKMGSIFHSAAYGRNARIWKSLLDRSITPQLEYRTDIVDMLHVVYYTGIEHCKGIVDAILESARMHSGFEPTEILKDMANIMVVKRHLNKTIIQALVNRRADVNIRVSHATTPSLLHEAVRSGDAPMVSFIIQAGADVNARVNEGPVALHYAAGLMNPAILQSLLVNGALPDLPSYGDETPLHWATSPFNHHRVHLEYKGGAIQEYQTIKLLVEYGADVNKATLANKHTPLHLIIKQGYSSRRAALAKLLLDKGADINAQDKDGKTPLHLASARQQHRFTLLLLERGADPEICDDSGKKASETSIA